MSSITSVVVVPPGGEKSDEERQFLALSVQYPPPVLVIAKTPFMSQVAAKFELTVYQQLELAMIVDEHNSKLTTAAEVLEEGLTFNELDELLAARDTLSAMYDEQVSVRRLIKMVRRFPQFSWDHDVIVHEISSVIDELNARFKYSGSLLAALLDAMENDCPALSADVLAQYLHGTVESTLQLAEEADGR